MSKKLFKRYLIFVSLMLSTVMIFLSFPLSALAIDGEVAGSAVTETAEEEPSERAYESADFASSDIIGAVAELEDRREENVKHFRLDNGSYEAVVYSNAVHRRDANGVWRDINNNLSAKSIGSKSVLSTSDGRAVFGDDYPSVTLSENGYSLEMSYFGAPSELPKNITAIDTVINTKTYTATVDNAAVRTENAVYSTIEEAAAVDNRSSVVYSAVNDNTSIEYILNGNDLKENIIVNGRADSYEYVFLLKLSGLSASLDENGVILITDTANGDVKYTIPAPYMYDAEGERSYAAEYELASVKAGLYLIKLTADNTWINAEGRAFPVTIDPSVDVSDYVFDAYTDSASPSTVFDTSELWISNTRTSYIKIFLPENIPSGSTINSSKLYAPYYYHAGVTSGYVMVGAYQVNGDWSEHLLTYNNRPTMATTPLAQASMTANGTRVEDNPGTAIFNITSAVASWNAGTSSNHGIALKKTAGTNGSVIVKSSETSHSPYLYINYSYDLPEGIYCIGIDADRVIAIDGYGSTLAEGTPIVTTDYTGFYADVENRARYFKVTKSGSRYILRSMIDNSLTISITDSGEVVTKRIPCDDADVASDDMFNISLNNAAGFTIRYPKNSKILSAPSAASSDNEVLAIDSTEATADSYWQFVAYTGVYRSGYILEFPSSWRSIGIVEGSSDYLVLRTWSTSLDTSTPLISLPSYSNAGTAAWDASLSKLTFQATRLGIVTFTCSVVEFGNESGTQGTVSYQIVPKEDVYHISNLESKKCIAIEGNSTANGAVIEQNTHFEGDTSKWEIEHVPNSNGYVRIKSGHSNLYLGVDSSNTSLVKQYSAQNDYTLWKIVEITTGVYIAPKATESLEYALGIPVGDQQNGTDLANAEIDELEHDSVWMLTPTLDIAALAIPLDGDRSFYFQNIMDDMETIGYTDNYHNHGAVDDGVTTDQLLEYMAHSKITLIRTHGEMTRIQTSNGFLTRDDLLNSLPENYFSYSELIIYGSCLTAQGGKYAENLVAATVDAGARTVIGFEASVGTRACNAWCELFFEKYITYYNDPTKTFETLAYDTTEELRPHPDFHVSLKSWIVAGEPGFPS